MATVDRGDGDLVRGGGDTYRRRLVVDCASLVPGSSRTDDGRERERDRDRLWLRVRAARLPREDVERGRLIARWDMITWTGSIHTTLHSSWILER